MEVDKNSPLIKSGEKVDKNQSNIEYLSNMFEGKAINPVNVSGPIFKTSLLQVMKLSKVSPIE